MRSVPQSDVPQSPFQWSRGTAARETLRYLDTNGIDAEPLLSKAELSRSQLSQDAGGISAASQCRFLDLAATAANDQLLGLHVAAEMDIRNAGLLFYLAAASATVTEALKHLARYAGTANEAVRFEISPPQSCRCAREPRTRRDRGFADLYGSFSVKWFFVCCRFLVWSGKAVPRPVACDQVPGARGRCQGTEMLAQLSGLPLSVACVSQRLDT